ncbi:MAG: DUF4952 domain-containing protein [Cocleimonas sp.]
MTTFKYFYFFIISAMLIFMQLSLFAQAAEPSCADYLKLNNSKPTHLTFRSCEKGKDAQLRVLSATYTLEGKYANEVESELNKMLKMPKLKFACCRWYTQGNGSFSHDGYNVSIRMSSEETILRHRDDWPKISEFYVTATLYLEES